MQAISPAIKSTASLALLATHSDSMAPTFNAGDVLLVDTAINSLEADAIYAFLYRGHFFVKRLMRMFDGGVLVISDNKSNYPAQELSQEQLQELEVKARILGTWKWMQL